MRRRACYNGLLRHLQIRGRRVHYRRCVPPRLRKVVGVREVVRSLGPDLVRAGHLAQDLDRRLDPLFGLADEGLVADAKALIRRLVDDWLAQKLEEDRDERAFDPGAYEDESLDGLNDARTIEAEALAEGDVRNALVDAQALVEGAGVEIEGDDLHRLAFEHQRARVRALKLIVEDREADLLGLERAQVGQGDRMALPPEKSAAPTVQELGERFVRDRIESNAWKSERIRDKDGPREVRRVVDFLGPERPIDAVTTDDMKTGSVSYLSGEGVKPRLVEETLGRPWRLTPQPARRPDSFTFK